MCSCKSLLLVLGQPPDIPDAVAAAPCVIYSIAHDKETAEAVGNNFSDVRCIYTTNYKFIKHTTLGCCCCCCTTATCAALFAPGNAVANPGEQGAGSLSGFLASPPGHQNPLQSQAAGMLGVKHTALTGWKAAAPLLTGAVLLSLAAD
jgi:hypothetical protein